MRKINKSKFERISRKRRKRTLKRRRNAKRFNREFLQSEILRFNNKRDIFVLLNSSCKFAEFLVNSGFKNLSTNISLIAIPEVFCLQSNYEESLNVLKKAVNLFEFRHTRLIEIDFSKCKVVNLSALFPLVVILMEYHEFAKKIQAKLSTINIVPYFTCRESKVEKVNHYLLLTRFLDEVESTDKNGLKPISFVGIYKGEKSRKLYTENKKSIVSTDVVDYINECLIQHSLQLNPVGRNNLEGILSEVLNNCEDHSVHSTWYMTANFLKEDNVEIEDDDVVSELNLCFLNLGYSIYTGFIDTKDLNVETFEKMKNKSEKILTDFDCDHFTEENLFTLYALQDNISRLKFTDESRGTGTMKFINSFLNIGGFEDPAKDYIPNLSILSGSTYLICDNKYKPFLSDNQYKISLNDEKDLDYPPNKSHLKNLPLHFPGTLITVKVYLNRNHINSKK